MPLTTTISPLLLIDAISSPSFLLKLAKRKSPPPPPPSLTLKTSCRLPLSLGARAASATASQSTEEVPRMTLLWRAAKLPIYSVGFVPVTVGCATAYLQTGMFFAKRYFVLLVASVLVITWLNLSNDVYDSDTGADRNKKESVVNITGSRNMTLCIAIMSLFLGLSGLIWAFLQAGDVRFISLVLCAILCGYVYQCPPFRLSYQGLGEPLCFSAFGPFATTAFYFANSSKNISQGLLPFTKTILVASLLVGLTTTLILFCSHFHQIDGDKAVGKLSPLVRIGPKAGSRLVTYGIYSLYALLLLSGILEALPTKCIIFCFLTAPVARLVASFVSKNYNNTREIFMAKYYCVRLHTFFGIALALGLFAAKLRV